VVFLGLGAMADDESKEKLRAIENKKLKTRIKIIIYA
jgi:hypothetical protein